MSDNFQHILVCLCYCLAKQKKVHWYLVVKEIEHHLTECSHLINLL